MKKKFKDIQQIECLEVYDEIKAYVNALINEATTNGALAIQNADNEYTREIGRLGKLCADYENNHITYKNIKVKSPLLN